MKINLITIDSKTNIAHQINSILNKRMLENYAKETPRDYLGASQIGEECMRKLQYQYKYKKQNFDTRSLRVLDIGKRLEDLIAYWMHLAGFDLITKNEKGEQFGFKTAGGKIQGHIDGIIKKWPGDLNEITGSMGHPWLWECKTMNAQNWNDFQKHGILASHHQYYIQVQIYMAYMDLKSCLLTALNKNTGELHHEIIGFDKEIAQIYSDRAVDVITSTEKNEILGRISTNKNFLACKICPYQQECTEAGEGSQSLIGNLFKSI